MQAINTTAMRHSTPVTQPIYHILTYSEAGRQVSSSSSSGRQVSSSSSSGRQVSSSSSSDRQVSSSSSGRQATERYRNNEKHWSANPIHYEKHSKKCVLGQEKVPTPDGERMNY